MSSFARKRRTGRSPWPRGRRRPHPSVPRRSRLVLPQQRTSLSSKHVERVGGQWIEIPGDDVAHRCGLATSPHGDRWATQCGHAAICRPDRCDPRPELQVQGIGASHRSAWILGAGLSIASRPAVVGTTSADRGWHRVSRGTPMSASLFAGPCHSEAPRSRAGTAGRWWAGLLPNGGRNGLRVGPRPRRGPQLDGEPERAITPLVDPGRDREGGRWTLGGAPPDGKLCISACGGSAGDVERGAAAWRAERTGLWTPSFRV